MAFGATSVLDDFNRANSDGLGAAWTEPVFGADTSTDMDVSSNIATSGAGSSRSNAYWNATTFGPDCEAYITFVGNPTNGRVSEVYARMTDVGGNADGYIVRMVKQAGTDIIRIFRVDNGALGSLTQLGADISQEVANGDKIGIECIGDQIAAYHYTAGAWTQVGVRTDATYGSAGYIGFGTNASHQFDDFGGGTVGGGGTTYNESPSGTVTSAGGLTKQTATLKAGTATSAGALAKLTATLKAGTLTSAGAVLKQTAKLFAGTVTSAGTLTTIKAALVTLGGTLTSAGGLTKQAGKAVVGTLTSGGALARLVAKFYTGTLTSAGAVAKAVSKFFAGSLASSGAMTSESSSATPATGPGARYVFGAKSRPGVVTVGRHPVTPKTRSDVEAEG